ncbi:MAG: CHAT domain-containing protein [Bacteroidota bacterium]
MKRAFCSCLIIACLSSFSIGQSTDLDSLVNLAKNEFKEQKYKAVIQHTRRIVKLALVQEDWSNYYQGAFRHLRVLEQQEKYVEGLDSLSVWLKRIPPDQNETLGKLIFYKGILQSAYHLCYASILSYKQALVHLIKINDHDRVIKLYQNISNQYARIHDYKFSRAYAMKALEKLALSSRLSYKKDILHEHIAQTYFWEGKLDEAISYLVQYMEKNGAYNEGQSLLAKFYTEMGDYEKAESLLNAIDVSGLYVKIDVLGAQKNISEEKGNLPDAIKYQRDICQLIPKVFTKREYFREQMVLANLLFENGEKKSAHSIVDSILAHFDIAIDNQFGHSTIFLNRSELMLAEALFLKSKLILNENAANHFELVKTSIACVEASIEIINQKRQYITKYEEKLGLSEIQRTYSEWAISLLKRYWDQDSDAKIFERALLFSQRTKAGILKESIEENQLLDACQIPEHLEHLWMSSKYFMRHSDADTLSSAYYTYDSLNNEVKKMCPQYDHFLHTPIVTISDIRNELDTDDHFINYHKINNEYHSFVITKDTLIWDAIPDSDRIDSLVNAIFEILSSRKEDSHSESIFIKNSSLIYNTLVRSYVGFGRNETNAQLYIVADGALSKLSFDALITEATSSWIDSKKYLMNKYTISNLYFCAQIVRDEHSDPYSQDFVGFGANYSKDYFDSFLVQEDTSALSTMGSDYRYMSFESLHNSVSEVTSICQSLGGRCIKEKDVILPSILKELKNSSIVHLSTHAYVNPDKIIESGFLIYPDSSGCCYKFTFKDVLSHRLSNDLVVLSSCQSLYGNLYESEGLLSLARAFVQSGGKSVVGNLWNISDNNTPGLMMGFYEYLRKGNPVSESMRLAKIKYLTDDNISSPSNRIPHYWSGWKVYGNTTPYAKGLGSLDYGVVLVGFFALIALFWGFILKRHY